MSETRRVIIALKTAAQAKHLSDTAKELHRLLQLAGISPSDPGEVILTEEQIDAGRFWCKILHIDLKITNPLMHKSARSLYGIMRVAAEEPGWKDFVTQAREYCHVVEGVCTEYLRTMPQILLAAPRNLAKFPVIMGGKYKPSRA
ncbi:MAG TPA: hypothetical protein VJJ20_03995 [Candidatus Paceibacterota bacterium]